MADDSRQQNKDTTEPAQEFKLEQDNELRFEVEGKEKVTLEVCFNVEYCFVWSFLLEANVIFSSNQDWLRFLAQSW